MTGHLVLSTLHTNDAASAVIRLMDMGIEPFLLNASLTGILAQRLARKICSLCKQMVELTAAERAMYAQCGMLNSAAYKGVGCNACQGRGYRGRIGIFELLVITPEMRALLNRNSDYNQLYKQASLDGMQNLMQDGTQKVSEGIITLDELIYVIL